MAEQWSVAWCEQRAQEFLRELELDRHDFVDAFGVFSHLGFKLGAWATPGCRGFVGAGRPDEDIYVCVRPGPTEQETQRRANHELGHAILWHAGIPLPHHEPAVDRIGLMAAIPCESALAAVAEHGLDPEKLIGAWPLIQPSAIFERVAYAIGGRAVFVRGRQQRLVANDTAPLDLLTEMRVHQLADSAVAGARPVIDRHGASAMVYSDYGSNDGGIIVLFPAAS